MAKTQGQYRLQLSMPFFGNHWAAISGDVSYSDDVPFREPTFQCSRIRFVLEPIAMRQAYLFCRVVKVNVSRMYSRPFTCTGELPWQIPANELRRANFTRHLRNITDSGFIYVRASDSGNEIFSPAVGIVNIETYLFPSRWDGDKRNYYRYGRIEVCGSMRKFDRDRVNYVWNNGSFFKKFSRSICVVARALSIIPTDVIAIIIDYAFPFWCKIPPRVCTEFLRYYASSVPFEEIWKVLTSYPFMHDTARRLLYCHA